MDNVDPYPHAPIAEKSVLSCMFRKPELIARAAAEGVDSSAFHLPASREILAQLVHSRDAGHVDEKGSIDLLTFVQDAAMRGTLARMGGPSDIYAVSSYALSMANWQTWLSQLRECKALRIAKDASGAISGTDTAEDAIKATSEALEAMKRAVTAKTRSMSAKEAANAFLTNFEKSYNNGDIPGQTCGILEIDEVTGGMRPGELWTIGGKSSSGKSVFMYQIGAEFAGNGKTVVIFSLELMPHEIIGRLVTLFARVPHDAITNPRSATTGDLGRIKNALKSISESKLWIDASSGQTLDTIAGEAERIRDIQGKIDLIIVDYLQIVTGQRNRNETREQEIARVSGGLKQLAKKLECPVITGSQLNDDGKTRESRAIEQDSDALLIIEEDGILLKKVRNGERGSSVQLQLDGSQQRFRRFINQ